MLYRHVIVSSFCKASLYLLSMFFTILKVIFVIHFMIHTDLLKTFTEKGLRLKAFVPELAHFVPGYC